MPYGATVLVADAEKVKPRQQLVVWDPHITPILAEKGGTVQYEDIEEGETVRLEEERKGGHGGEMKLVVIEHKGERHPRITIVGDDGKILDFHYLPAKARIEVRDGQKIEAGHMLARQPRESTGTQDITGGLPRVTEIFEARKPKDPAVLAEISGAGSVIFTPTGSCLSVTAAAPSNGRITLTVPMRSAFFPRSTLVRRSSIER